MRLTILIGVTIASMTYRCALAQSLHAIEAPPGMDMTIAHAISGDGRVTTGYASAIAGDGLSQSFLWTHAGGTQLLDIPPGDIATAGNALSYDGSFLAAISGSAALSSYATRWSAATGFETLHPPGAQGSVPYSISYDGQVVVGQAGSGNWQAFRWTQSTGLVYLSGGGDAHAVSGDGVFTLGSTNGRAARWEGLGAPQLLANYLGDQSSAAFAATEHAEVVVGYSVPASGSPRIRAIRWVIGGVVEDLGTLVPGIGAFANGVSGDGAVVIGDVETADLGNDSSNTAFVWTEGSGMRSVMDVLSGLGVDTTGWLLYSATGISADGQTIVGRGLFNGDRRGWVATFVPIVPPPPCADVSGDGLVNFVDITSILSTWGTPSLFGDADHNGVVNFADITAVLTYWGSQCNQ